MVKHSELVTAPPCAKELPEKPEYLFRLTLGLHPDLEDDRTVTLELPASAEALREVQKQLGADGWEGAMVLDYDGIIPQAAEFADLPMELDAFNDFAEAVEAMPSREKQIPKLKALLEHFEVTDLATAAGLAEHIGDYILTPEISSPQEAAIDELNFTMDAHSAELLLPHVNLFTYGNEIIKDDQCCTYLLRPAASGGLSADADSGAGNSRSSNDDGISKGHNRATMEMRNAVFN